MPTITEKELYFKHWGVPGMHWGQRKASAPTSGPTHRKTSLLPTSADGRKVNKLLGARNRKKIRNFFLGDPDAFIREFPGMKKKYNSLSKEDKIKAKSRISKGLAAASVVSMVSFAALLAKG